MCCAMHIPYNVPLLNDIVICNNNNISLSAISTTTCNVHVTCMMHRFLVPGNLSMYAWMLQFAGLRCPFHAGLVERRMPSRLARL